MASYATSNAQGILGQPEEVAWLISFLQSDAARATTMEDIQINAGSIWLVARYPAPVKAGGLADLG